LLLSPSHAEEDGGLYECREYRRGSTRGPRGYQLLTIAARALEVTQLVIAQQLGVHPGFSLYIVLLAISGALMVGIGSTAFSGQSTDWRIFNVVADSAFVGYAVYLAFLFEGGTYIIFFKAFILPAFMLINAIRSAVARWKSSAPQQAGWPDPQQAG
jgi:hypothetical protein